MTIMDRSTQQTPPPAHSKRDQADQAMKGLEQAVNIKLWPGNGEPAKAWGKLKQDPELWDDSGDTLIFFGQNRPEPSFRIRSSLLRESKSPALEDMLYNGTLKSRESTSTTFDVVYEIFMPPPAKDGKVDVLRHHITTRNFFAFLRRQPLVGFTFYQALVDLHERLEEYLPPTMDCAGAIKAYLVTIGLVNVCNEPRAAAGLLAWSEDVRWNEGWREAFVHSVGMYEKVSEMQECADVSLPTKAHLDRAHLELQARIHEAEESLTSFYFDDAHFSQEDMSPTLRAASSRFRRFLRQFYEKVYQTWPPKKGQSGLWLDRKNVNRLQQDFNALYEYGVDRNVSWNEDIDIDDRSKRYLLKSVNSQDFGLDAEDFRMLGVFQNLDCRLNVEDVPYPYPLLPTSISPPVQTKKPVFRGKRQDKARESRVALAYAESSNASELRREYAENDLLKAFIQFEKADQPGDIDPREARRERWILIYSILQTLAGISVDVPHLNFKGDVSYFLNARLQGLPPWSPTDKIYMDASREQSHCWTASEMWATKDYDDWSQSKRSQSDEKSVLTYQSRPLSPASHSSAAFAFVDSPPPTPIGDFDSNDGLQDRSSYTEGSTLALSQGDYDSSTTSSSMRYPLFGNRGHESSTTLMTEGSINPDKQSSEYRTLSAIHAPVIGISQYNTRPLPLRPGRPSNRDVEFPKPPRR